jgi:hypothetical protein
MKNEEQRIRFINSTMDCLHNLCDDLYEALMDSQFDDVKGIAEEMEDHLSDLKETFSNEI